MTVTQGDLARCITHEPDSTWPELVEIVCYFGPKRTKRRSVAISAEEFFGTGTKGAPLSGERLIRIIDNLRKSK